MLALGNALPYYLIIKNGTEKPEMKDPNDKQTIDGFADLVTLVENAPTLKKVGRPPQGERALTPGEKQKAYRDRQRAARQAEAQRLADIRAGEPVTSSIIDLDTAFVDVYRSTRGKA
jgi:hypothetical protein